ncbi:MAG TPA: metallophosphoesterase [Thermoanaerobaculia bacterium]|nr:metallophosphoesterase [Thermoanaerobaculia bacterium]
MATNFFSWLHLTDFHYGLKGQDCLWPTLREPFLDSLAALHERCGPWDAVLFTGDLVQSGETAQFEKMQAEVLDPLWEKLRELGSGNAVLLAVPGNHDLYRPNPLDDNAAVDVLLEKDGFQRIEAKFWDQPASSYRRVITDAFAAYSQWWGKAPHRPGAVKTGALPGDFSVTLECGGRRIGIVGLNTTFLQLAGGDYEGRLVWDARQLHAVCDGGVDTWSKQHDICLLLTHQGPNWLTPEAQKQGESEIAPAGRFAVHFFGHQHEADITYIRRGGSGQAVRLCQGCSAFGMDKFGEPPKIQRAHGYAAGQIEFGRDDANLRLWPLRATSATGRWRFIPDHDHAELEEDLGTPPEPVAARSRAAAPTKTTTVVAISAETTSPAPGPHSTLPAQRPFFGRTKELEKIAVGESCWMVPAVWGRPRSRSKRRIGRQPSISRSSCGSRPRTASCFPTA